MSTVTMYGVQAFTQKGKSLKPDAPRIVSSERAAVRMAEDLARTRPGVYAFSRSGDSEMGEFDDPVILASHGEIPASDGF
jgi:hypothetical protein